MSRPLALVVALVLSTASLAKDNPPLGPPVPTLAQVHEKPDDAKLLNRFVGGYFREVSHLSEADPTAANKKLDELAGILDKLTATGEAAQLIERAKGSIESYRENIASAKVTVAEAEKALLAKPDDAAAFNAWQNKALGELYGMAYSRPDEVEARMAAIKDFVAKVAESAKDEEAKKRLESLSGRLQRALTQVTAATEQGRKYAKLVGKEAAPLVAESWVNGQPVTDADLKGKVVLLDFWAIWCGPCINTFGHLREWNEKYADKGLVMIGVTSQYKYKWDEEAGYCAADPSTTPEEELAMLEKFADYYQLTHRFAVTKQGNRELSEYYGVSGIPHVVVIDKEGKVRMIRVGSGKQNADDIGKLLAELLDK
jgi:thiol-disulfide isomerase/thioredoxin